MSLGLRVVRGPDWNLGDADGGDGHLGTIVQTNTDGTVKIQWDMGKKSMNRAGNGGKFDLRVLDSAPVGVRHENVTCDVCSDGVLLGTRWKCGVCDNYDLCLVCYSTDKHNLQHSFIRIDTPGSKGVAVAKRSTSFKMRGLGTFVGAKVVRGPNWEYGTQDGGDGKRGEVTEMKRFGSLMADRNGVRVQWPSGERNIYRLGFKGQVDVLCVEEAPGPDYYRDHLANVSTASTNTPQPGKPGEKAAVDSSLKVGDKVCVFLPPDALKEVQNGHGGWSRRMAECIGQIATVKRFVGNSDVEIQHDGDTWRFFTGAVMKVHDLKLEDTVEILDKKDTVHLLQKGHGGWNEQMTHTLGKVGRVVKIDSDGDVAVAFGRQAFVYNPACCKPAPGRKPDTFQMESDSSNDDDEAASTSGDDSGVDPSDLLASMMLKVLMMGRMGSATSSSARFVSAAANGNTPLVTGLLSRDKNLVKCRHQGLTALIIASHEGHQQIVKALLEAGANKEDTDKSGNTALLAALMGKKEETAILLAEKGCKVTAVNNQGRTALHMAAYENMPTALKLLLQKGCNPNLKDGAGDTPLHDAISKLHDAPAKLLISCSKTELDIPNKKSFNSLQMAAFKDHVLAVELIVTRNSGLSNVPKGNDGSHPLHIAAINNHVGTARILVKKGNAKVDPRNRAQMTPLHLAAHEGYADMVEFLVENGADLGSCDGDGDTPLHMALLGRRTGDSALLQLLGMRRPGVQNERIKIACFLIEKGADIGAKNKRGGTPLQVCSDERVRDAVKSFADKRGKATPRGRGQSLADLLFELPIRCMACSERMADARFVPCRHKVFCKACCFRVDECPLCDASIDQRVDLNGQRIVQAVQCAHQ